MASLFDYLKRLTNKTPIDETKEQFEKDYNPWMINQFMSCDKQFIHLANAMNREGFTKEMNFDFYDNAIPKVKRFIKYSAKKEKTEKTIQYVMEWYGCSQTVAKQYMEIISKEELDDIIHHFEKERKGRN